MSKKPIKFNGLTNPIKCVKCNVDLIILDYTKFNPDQIHYVVHEGNLWPVQGNYGSKYDTEQISIPLCDKCFKEILHGQKPKHRKGV